MRDMIFFMFVQANAFHKIDVDFVARDQTANQILAIFSQLLCDS